MTARRFAVLLPLLALSACMTPRAAPFEVTRYHLGGVNERGTVAIEPAPGMRTGMEFAAYSDAVARELGRIGFAPVDGVAKSLYVAVVDVRSGARPAEGGRSPISIGIGGSTGGWRGGGVGGGISFPIGSGRGGLEVGAELTVQLKRRSDQTIVWDGRARGEAAERESVDLPARLANALFRDFPGESGATISVP